MRQEIKVYVPIADTMVTPNGVIVSSIARFIKNHGYGYTPAQKFSYIVEMLMRAGF